jgi:hypothetical protein
VLLYRMKKRVERPDLARLKGAGGMARRAYWDQHWAGV